MCVSTIGKSVHEVAYIEAEKNLRMFILVERLELELEVTTLTCKCQ